MTVAFCGLPRNPPRFFRSVDELNKSRIIFSSWEGKVGQDLQSELHARGVELLLNKEPSPVGHGSIWAQMDALRHALAACDDNEVVLKTRTDAYISPAFLQKVQRKYNEAQPVARPSIFSHRVWVPCFEITKPFYIAEEMFLGSAGDLRHLINYDQSFDAAASKDGGGETHIRRFMFPFMRVYPELEDYKQYLIRGDYTGTDKPNRFSLLAQRLTEDEYIGFLAIYYFVLYTHFIVYNESGALVWHQAYSDPSRCLFDYGQFLGNFSPTLVCSETPHKIWCYDSKWIENLVGGKFSDPLATQLQEKMGLLYAA